MIEGVVLHRLQAHADARGSFTEVYADVWGLPIVPRQFALVQSTPGTLRGMHLHLRHDESLVMVSGRAFVGLHDLRPDAPSCGRSMLIELDARSPCALVFPAGIVHGWYFPEGGLHLQGVSVPYREYGGDDNLGCRWDDPELGLSWPGAPLHLSERARRFPALAHLREHVRERLAGRSDQLA